MPISDAVRAEIEKKAQRAQDALNRGDMAGFVATVHHPDGVISPNGHPPVKGHAQIAAWLEGFPPFTNMKFDLLEVDGDGDCAYAWGSYSFDLVDDDGNVIGSDNGTYLEIWRRGDDGWRVTRDIFNSDVTAEE